MTTPCSSEVVLFEKRGAVAWITLNRPEKLNALNEQIHLQLARIWHAFETDDALKIGILTGTGSKAFSVGQDLKELVGRAKEGAPGSSFGNPGAGWPRLTERFDISKPLIARVNGYAFGGGFELALACDLIVAAQEAEFALPEARLGLIAGAGGLFRLTRHIPLKTAMGYLMTGRRISAQRGYELGLVNEVAPSNQLDAAVDRWIADILACAPLSLRAIKEVAAKSATLSLQDAFRAHYVWEDRRRQSSDCREGPLAFVERRAPHWSGK